MLDATRGRHKPIAVVLMRGQEVSAQVFFSCLGSVPAKTGAGKDHIVSMRLTLTISSTWGRVAKACIT